MPDKHETLVNAIAYRLMGIDQKDMSEAERHIADLLVADGVCHWQQREGFSKDEARLSFDPQM